MARRIAKWATIVAGGLALIAGALLLFVNSDPGKRFVLGHLAAFETESGLNIRAQRIEGSLYGRMVLTGVEVRDPQGAFLTAPRLTIDWRPLAYAGNRLDIRELSGETARLIRLPALRDVPADPDAPLLPDLDIAIGKLGIARIIVEPAVTGRRHVVSLDGRADIADGRATVVASAGALRAAGLAGGDRLALTLDAVPDANRLILNATLEAPTGGLVDSYARLGKPLSVRIDGRGDWKAWNGRAVALLEGAPLVDLPITARDGTFTARGTVDANRLLNGPSQRLLAPRMAVDLVTTLAERRADSRLVLRSDALAVDAAGLIDLGESRVRDLRIAALLLKPGVIAPNLSGRDIRLAAVVNGAFARPEVAYRVTAGAFVFNTTGVEGFSASGRARVDADRILIPVAATARRVTGLNAAAGGLLTNLTANGDVAFSGGRLLTDNLLLRSDRIDATAIAIADLNTGRYTGALKGRVNDYQVDGLGRINVVTSANLVTDARGRFGISGIARVVTRRLTNEAIATQLEGNATTVARFGFDGDGVISVRALRLTSPGLQVFDGNGSYRPDGRIDFRARGRSRNYGPLTLLAWGSLERPRVRLVADRPGFGLGLRGVTADLVGTPAGYQINARGGSDYGPFSADVLIRTGRGPLTIDVARGRLAGIDVRGRLVQTGAGPYAGSLALVGSGIAGNVGLSAVGDVQRADFALNATGGRIPGDQAISIGSGTVRGIAILYPNAPSLNADFRLANVVQGDLLLTRAQGRIRYQNGQGNAALVTSGQTTVPFDLAAQAAFAPDRVVANARGTANGIAFSLAQPAVVTRTRGAWALQPATIVIPQGRVQLSGTYGNAITARAALDNVDLSLAQAFAPGLGLGGKASGTIDYVQGGTTIARLTVQRFTRTAAYTVSAPVDIAMLAQIDRRGGDVRAVVRRGTGVVGRLQARLAGQPLTRAALAGGIRYNGPAEVLWALTGIADQQLAGPIVVAADFGGTADRPKLTGLIRGDALRYENQTYGTVITNLAIGGRFSQSQLQLTNVEGRAGRGTVSGQGTIGLDSARGFPADLRLTFANAQLARSNALGATVSGTLAIVNGPSGGRVSGELRVPEARYEFVRAGTAEVAELRGVRRRNAVVDPRGTRPAPAALGTNIALDIRVRAGNRIFVSGMGLEAEWGTDMRITGTAANPRVVGDLDIVRGTYSFAGRRFDLDNSGRVTFDGGVFTNPQIALVARTSVEGVSATINISGRAQNPQIAFSSTPALPQDEVLSRLLFGSSITELTPVQAIQLAAALNSLRGSGGGVDPLGKLRSASGISRLRVLGEDKSQGRGTALAVGQYISNNIYVEVVTDARGFTATQLEIGLSRALSLLSATSSFGGSSATLRYSRDY